jgi:hypothetical protein
MDGHGGRTLGPGIGVCRYRLVTKGNRHRQSETAQRPLNDNSYGANYKRVPAIHRKSHDIIEVAAGAGPVGVVGAEGGLGRFFRSEAGGRSPPRWPPSAGCLSLGRFPVPLFSVPRLRTGSARVVGVDPSRRTTPWRRSGARLGWRCEAFGRGGAVTPMPELSASNDCLWAVA